MTAVLVINSGSSSIKYQLVDPDTGEAAAKGLVDRVGQASGRVTHESGPAGSRTKYVRDLAITDHAAGMRLVLDMFATHGPDLAGTDLTAVGHRLVQGGELVVAPTVVTDDLLAGIVALSPLAPLHNPANVTGIEVARHLWPNLPHVVVADTAFFHDLPPVASTYALDRQIAAQHGIRRYGFHGTSHAWVSRRMSELTGREDLRQVVLHLGNGASASAVVAGRPVETSMGLTPLEGLVMGTRSGDIDPAVIAHLHRATGMDAEELDSLLNQRSGLLGLTGHSDMREVKARAEDGDEAAILARSITAHRIRKYIGSYAAVMGGVDAVAFTAGIGENDAALREECLAGLGFLGLEIDPDRNRHGHTERCISPEGASGQVWVVPTNEERAIAVQTALLVRR